MAYYVVQANDHLDKIAFRAGSTPAAIWEHASNERIRQKRGSGDILHPGDVLFLPDPPPREKRRINAGSEKTFQATVPTTRIQLRILDAGKPAGGQPWIVETSAGKLEGTTTADGGVDVKIPVRATHVALELPKLGIRRDLAVGGVDPLGEISGVQARLKQLGHYQGPIDGAASEALGEAVGRFRKASGLPAGDAVDPAFLEALKSQFGC
jgi:hypothetical protein